MKHLTSRQLDHLRDLLRHGEQRLRARIDEEREKVDNEELPDTNMDSGDEADKAFAELQLSVQRELISYHVAELKALEAALARIAAGSFGLCLDCGTEIDYARLEAQPSAGRCGRCQALHEKTFASRLG